MKHSSWIPGCALLATLGLSACDKPQPPVVVTVPPAPMAVPGPAGPTGATGETGKPGAAGMTGTPGAGTTVIVATPAPPASAPSN